MSNDILVVAECMNGLVSDVSYEMVGKAREIAPKFGGQVITVVLGSGMADAAATLASDSTLYVDDPVLEQFNPEAYGKVIEALVTERSPRLTLLGWTSVGMDLAAWLSIRTGHPLIAYCNGLTLDGEELVASSQVYGGKIEAECIPHGESAIVAVLAGAFPAAAGQGTTSAEQILSPVSLEGLKTRFVEMIMPPAGDIDITAQDRLVAIGRGIGGADNVELAEDLAEALDATVAASRPVTDAGWLPKTRQVGKSGLKVKPKLYLTLGISGAPEHLEGMKDASLIIAINTDENAPIFDVAHFGTTEDLFDVAEAMVELLDG